MDEELENPGSTSMASSYEALERTRGPRRSKTIGKEVDPNDIEIDDE